MPSAQAPLVTDWISAIGQVAGAVATFAAVALALAIAIKDSKRLASETRDREAAAARLVTATVRRDVGLVYLEIRNDGVETVYNLKVGAVKSNTVSYIVTDQKVEERNGRFVAIGSKIENTRTLMPREVRSLVLEVQGAVTFTELDSSAVATLEFTDSTGLQWIRLGAEPPIRKLTS